MSGGMVKRISGGSQTYGISQQSFESDPSCPGRYGRAFAFPSLDSIIRSQARRPLRIGWRLGEALRGIGASGQDPGDPSDTLWMLHWVRIEGKIGGATCEARDARFAVQVDEGSDRQVHYSNIIYYTNSTLYTITRRGRLGQARSTGLAGSGCFQSEWAEAGMGQKRKRP
jgi:hypothetical protein